MILIFQKNADKEWGLIIRTHADRGVGGQKFADVFYRWPLEQFYIEG